MSKIKVMLSVIVAVAALSSVVASGASAAAGWYVNGASLKTTAALATTAAVDAAATLNEPAETFKVTCTGGSPALLDGVNPLITAGNTGDAESLKFLGCSEVTPANCSLETTEVKTEPVSAVAATSGAKAVRVTFTPVESKLFVTLHVKGASCAVAGEKPVTGGVTFNAPTGQTESTLQVLEGLGSVENNQLLVAKHPAFIEGGSALLKLASNLGWSFHS
jgi:hypothetical protein